jgi:RimK family alpha-L-glutamate ligase
MQVAVLGESAGWHVGRLTAALATRGHRASVVRWAEMTAGIGDARPSDGSTPGDARECFGPQALNDADAILVRGMPGAAGQPSGAAGQPSGAVGQPSGAAGQVDRLEEVVFRMDALGRIAARGTRVMNNPRSLELAIDKYLSLARLAAAGLPVPRTRVVQDVTHVADARELLGGDCVVKPLFGSRGRGLHRLDSRDAIAAWLDLPDTRARPGQAVYLQEFVRHSGWDVRLFILGPHVFAMRRRAAPGDWRTNVARGGRPEPFDPPPEWINLARRAAAVLDTEIAGVDLVPAPDGSPRVLEVNAVPGWRALEAVTGVDIATEVVRHLETTAG